MKVLILTQPLGHNYGGLLQAYALQVYLKKIGCEVETLNRRMPENRYYSIKNYLVNVIKLILGRIKSVPTSKKRTVALASLEKFRDEYIKLSPELFSDKKVKDYCESEGYEAFIVGSDQVWRPRYSPGILNFYLNFLGDDDEAKRIAYAASFGVDEWEYPIELTENCKKLASKFDEVSVREVSAIDLCRDNLGVNAKWVVDPTLLLEPNDYEPLILAEGEIYCQDRVLSYVLDPEQEKRSIAGKVGEILDFETFSIKPELSIAQVRANNQDLCSYPSVEKWLKAFYEARFVVTDSFHGTVFSILFNKPFIAIGNPSRGMARFESLLSQFDLKDRLIDSQDQISEELVEREIDWVAVNSKRQALVNESKDFLEQALGI